VAAKRNKQIVAATVAVTASEAFGEHSAFKEGAKLLLDVARQAAIAVLARVGEKGFEVLADQAIENRLGRASRKVRGGESSHGLLHKPDAMPRSRGGISRRKRRASAGMVTFDGGGATAFGRPRMLAPPIRVLRRLMGPARRERPTYGKSRVIRGGDAR
jgi:hypothetical protein